MGHVGVGKNDTTKKHTGFGPCCHLPGGLPFWGYQLFLTTTAILASLLTKAQQKLDLPFRKAHVGVAYKMVPTPKWDPIGFDNHVR